MVTVRRMDKAAAGIFEVSSAVSKEVDLVTDRAT